MKFFIYISLLLPIITLSACETEEDNKLSKAQDCYNKAKNATEVNACLSIISSLNSTEANTLKCGMAMYIGGINSAKISTAFDDKSSSSSTSANLLKNLVMTSTTAADEAYEYCKASGSVGLFYIATLTKSATVMEDIAGGASANPQELIDDCLGNASCKEQIGGLITDMAAQYCVGESAQNDVCKNALAAINAGGSLQTIGANFLNQIRPP
jgi:hypothetical protein